MSGNLCKIYFVFKTSSLNCHFVTHLIQKISRVFIKFRYKIELNVAFKIITPWMYSYAVYYILTFCLISLFREHTMKDFARLNVYIADSNVIITQEMEDYTSTQLVSDIGGQLGLWVGISIITLAEVSNFHITFFCTAMKPICVSLHLTKCIRF